jgi:hypothetical protein
VSVTTSAPLGDEEALTPASIARLAATDIDDLSDAEVVGFMSAWARVRDYADGQIARAVLALRERAPAGELIGADQLVAAEVAAALHLGMGGADRLVATAVGLARRFPATMAAVQAGGLSWAKAATLVEQTSVLDDANAAHVEARVLPFAAERTPAQHRDAVRRTVDRVDAAGADERRRRAQRDIALVRHHVGAGMGELFARMASEQLDTVWLGADAWARRRKAAGDIRTLEQLRVAALVQWAQSFLVHGDPSRCDYECEPSTDVDHDDDGQAPRRHARPVRLVVLWDIASFLGTSARCGELADSGATLPPQAMREFLEGGATVRRLLVDADTGELVDLSACHAELSRLRGTGHRQPVELHVIVTTDELRAMQSGDDPSLTAALEASTSELRDLLLAPVAAQDLDATPHAYPAPARLAEHVGVRDRHPTNPSAGLSAARAGDIDHVVSVRAGGRTVRDNLHSPTRRWHRLRTFGGWSVARLGRGWRWTSWTGRSVTTRPHDYRLGP